MILETLQLIADGLNHPTIGVNAQMLSTPTGSIQVVPVPVQLIGDESRHAEIAADQYSGPYPALLIANSNPVVLNQKAASGLRDAEMTVVISLRHKAMPQNTAVGSALFIMRAVQRSIEALFANTNADLRTRNGVQLISYSTMQQYPTDMLEQSDIVVLNMEVTMTIRDIIQ